MQVLREPRFGRLPVPSVGVAAVLACRLEAGRAVPLGIPVAVNSLQQRVALELRFHIGGKVEMGELEQLDRLQQLRRHHQGLPLAHLQPLHQRH